eukprot:12882251-Prorocentrum_lima.AAC.1
MALGVKLHSMVEKRSRPGAVDGANGVKVLVWFRCFLGQLVAEVHVIIGVGRTQNRSIAGCVAGGFLAR